MSPSPARADRIAPPQDIPELGPSLGRVIVPRRLTEPWIPLDDIREDLATRIFRCAGEARTAPDPQRATEAVGRSAWAAVWEQAVGRTADRLAEALDREIELAARRVRMPRRRWKRLRLAGSERRAVVARLASGGSGFIAALDQVEAAASEVRLAEAGGGDPAAVVVWQESLLTAARRLEAAWLALETQVASERERWAPELAAIERWRPALWPVYVIGLPLWAALIWLGLVLGGYLPAPPWLGARLGF